MTKATRSLRSYDLPRALRLSLLWASMMFLYLYNDYFSLYLPGTIEGMRAGQMGPLGEATDAVMVGVAMLMAIPSLMVFLSAALPAFFSKWSNIALGAAYTFVNGATFLHAPLFYQVIVGLEILLSLAIIWSALTWPKE